MTKMKKIINLKELMKIFMILNNQKKWKNLKRRKKKLNKLSKKLKMQQKKLVKTCLELNN